MPRCTSPSRGTLRAGAAAPQAADRLHRMLLLRSVVAPARSLLGEVEPFGGKGIFEALRAGRSGDAKLAREPSRPDDVDRAGDTPLWEVLAVSAADCGSAKVHGCGDEVDVVSVELADDDT